MSRENTIDNLSNNSDDSKVPQIQLDSQGNSYIVWADESAGNGDIFFKRWDSAGKVWTKMDGSTGIDNLSNNSGESANPQIFLNSSDNPLIVWEDTSTGSSDIYFTYWDGAKWAKLSNGAAGYDNLSNNAGGSIIPRFWVDSSNNPYVVWQDYTTGNDEIYFIKWTPINGWTQMDGTTPGYENLSNNAGISRYAEIQLDSNNIPYVVWPDTTTGANDIYFTKWTQGIGWTQMDGVTLGYDNLSNNAGASIYPKIQLNSNNDPYIAWYDGTTGGGGNSDVYFSKWTPGVGWTRMDGVTLGYNNLSNNSSVSGIEQIQLDAGDNPYVVWHDDATGNFEIYLSKWTPGVGWTKMDGVTLGYENISNNSGDSVSPQIQLDSVGHPYIAWLDVTLRGLLNYDFYFTKWTPGAGPGVCGGIINDCWSNMAGTTLGYEIISNDSGGGASVYFQMKLNNVNFPYFVWEDTAPGNSEIYFTHWLLQEQGQINIYASVDPSLTLNLSSTTCNLGTFDSTKVNTCQYNTTVTTNASSGYTAYIRDDGNLRNATNDINDVTGGTTAAGSEEYGLATSDADTVDITAKESSADCATANGGISDVNALALTTADQSFATASAPINADVVTLCHSASITNTTPAGSYAQMVTITVVGNF